MEDEAFALTAPPEVLDVPPREMAEEDVALCNAVRAAEIAP